VANRYSAIGAAPAEEPSIPVGREWAIALGYPERLLESIPTAAVDAFTGIGAPLLLADLKGGDVVLDLGCGAGVDAILASSAVGKAGQVRAVDFAPAMVGRARSAVSEAGCHNVSVREASAVSLPLADQSVDVVLVNGLFNLTPDKEAVVRELQRVLRQSGRIVASEIVITDGKPAARPDLESWFR
jgi:ubiquinone/menaquinone biosynthesis C-methylase UbiE